MNQIVSTAPALTADQQAGADAFFRFLMDPVAKKFVISGGPGVGKTFLMAHLVRNVMKDYAHACSLLGIKEAYDTLAFTATTNKAAEVLEESLNLPVQTIHSYLGLRVQENHRTGKTYLERTRSFGDKYRTILFIDECSMVDTQLYEMVLETMKDSKIIFVGDHCQMAPVGEKISPVFENLDEDNFVFLSKPVRNANYPDLVKLCAQLRDTVETGVFRPIQEVPGVIDYLTDDDMAAGLYHFFEDDKNPPVRVLCYTNTRVEDYNQFIREDVRKQPAEFQVGDTLVVAQNHANGKQILNVEREVEIMHIGEVSEDRTFSEYTVGNKPILYREVTVKEISGCMSTVIGRLPVNKGQVAYAIKCAARCKAWSDYFDLKNTYLDLRDKASCTVYKAQGSTYDVVFVDLGNIGTSFDADQVARMLLVAVSRARSRVLLYGQLPPAYRGKHAES